MPDGAEQADWIADHLEDCEHERDLLIAERDRLAAIVDLAVVAYRAHYRWSQGNIGSAEMMDEWDDARRAHDLAVRFEVERRTPGVLG